MSSSPDGCNDPADSVSARLHAADAQAIADAGRLAALRPFHGAGAVRAGPGLLRQRRPPVRPDARPRAATSSPRPSSRRCSAGRWRARWRRRCDAAQADEVFEFGAGSGALAAQLLRCPGRAPAPLLDRRPLGQPARAPGRAPGAPAATACGGWTRWPERLHGVVVGNEVLDAMPVQLLHWDGARWFERGVVAAGDALAWSDRATALRPPLDPDSTALRARHGDRDPPAGRGLRPQPGRPARARRGLLHRLRLPRGRVLPPAAHRRHADVPPRPSRRHRPADRGRRQGHHRPCRLQRHRAGRPGRRPRRPGLHLAGALPAQLRPARPAAGRRRARAAAAQKLLTEHEMGELFKVIGFARGLADRTFDAIGFAAGDRSHTL